MPDDQRIHTSTAFIESLPDIEVPPEPLSMEIWSKKHRWCGHDGTPFDQTPADTTARVANALAAAEDPSIQGEIEQDFLSILNNDVFLPGGRIKAGAGTGRDVTLLNCYVMGRVDDSMSGIFDALKDNGLTLKQGGGTGTDFSTIRPAGAHVSGVDAPASGPVSFMRVWDQSCGTIMSAGTRRGAMMGTLHVSHPDIMDFITAKRQPGVLTNFNISVLVTDAFMQAVKDDKNWDLTFGGKTYNTMPARQIWQAIMESNYHGAEPGVIFIDRVNAENNLNYVETISATNPCGEVPLPPYGACLLGSINLIKFIDNAFTPGASLNLPMLQDVTSIAVRLLDNVIDVSRYPLPQQDTEAQQKRRLGLGYTALANALMALNQRYGSDDALNTVHAVGETIEDAAYRASALLAREKGPFPLFDREAYLKLDRISRLSEETRELIAEHGLRNSHLTAIAPTGTISLIADNVSSGIEPVFSHEYTRKVKQPDGSFYETTVSDHGIRYFRAVMGNKAELPAHFVTTDDLTPTDHLRMLAAAQAHVDQAISKTINCPADIPEADFEKIYLTAFELGCKGCTTYRPNEITGSILSTNNNKTKAEIPEILPMVRPEVLNGRTYKIRWYNPDQTYYLTINSANVDGQTFPFEIFISTKDSAQKHWIDALTLMITAIFRRGGNVAFVIDELRSITDVKGGRFENQKYVASLPAAIANAIEDYLISISYMTPKETIAPKAQQNTDHQTGEICPACSAPSMIAQNSCSTCVSCGYSSCG